MIYYLTEKMLHSPADLARWRFNLKFYNNLRNEAQMINLAMNQLNKIKP